MPNTKAYTSSHQAFWAASEQTTSLCFNNDQISAAEGPQVQNCGNSKGPTFIKCEQELR